MISLATDYTRLIISKALKTSTTKLDDVQNRLSTGLKLNCAKDNAANYSISTNLTTKLGAYKVAEDNIKMGLDLVQTATGSLSLIEDKLVRLRSLAVQAKNGTYGSQSLAAINSEANALVDEIDRLYNSTEYNGVDLYSNGVNISSLVKAGEDGFINHVEKRDTSSMTKLSEVDGSQKLAKGTYSINDIEDLEKLAKMSNSNLISVGCNFVLCADIDMEEAGYSKETGKSWIPIGDGVKFNGNFDGNGHIISNIYIESGNFNGLFGFVGKNSKIENVGIKNAYIIGDTLVGGVVGCNQGVVINCYVANSIIVGRDSTGGICGKVELGGMISDCNTNANVEGSYNAGGISGGCNGDNSQILNCISLGKITGINNIGGIVGLVGYQSGNNKIINCNSYGEIIGIDNMGGCVGLLAYNGGNNLLKDSNSYANVKGKSNVGGLVGYVDNNSEVTNCSVAGNINGTTSIGGITGGLSRNSTITNCSFKNGTISGDNELGGLVGSVNNVGNSIKNSSYIGESTNLDGLIVGKISNKSELTVDNLEFELDSENDIPHVGINEGSKFIESNINIKIKNASLQNSIFIKVGYGSDENSIIDINLKLNFENLNNLKFIQNNNYLENVDSFINIVTTKQTELGAVENRLLSALDEVGISYENVLSTRSTLRDADVAKISSEYVQQQILQQASATLLSTTANFRRENILALIQGIR